MKKLILVVLLGLMSVSCATPTTPKFPQITCPTVEKLTKKDLEILSKCRETCTIPRALLKKIHDRYQAKSSCLEEYQAAARIFQ